jgi:putative SOS response-associated peptidase YedK
MCSHYDLKSGKKLQERFKAEPLGFELQENYSAYPGQMLPVITRNSPARIELMNWGYVPGWASKDPKSRRKMFNARAETLTEKIFKNSLKSKRCLVPASGFFEWKDEDGKKSPVRVKLKEGDLFSFAGLYESYTDLSGAEFKSYTIITVPPNSLMESIHDRMPVILKPSDEDRWIDPKLTDWDDLKGFLDIFPSELMEIDQTRESAGSENTK